MQSALEPVGKVHGINAYRKGNSFIACYDNHELKAPTLKSLAVKIANAQRPFTNTRRTTA